MDAVGYCLFPTGIGLCGIAWGDNGIVALQIPEHDDRATRARIRRHTDVEATPPALVTDAIDGIQRVLDGDRDDLRWVQLDLSGVTEFHRDVYEATRAIPPGQVRSYGEVAAASGAPGAAQAVGQALGRNPIPLLIPCHRVLAADNTLHGFTAYGGIVTKRNLLALEHAPGFDDPMLF